MPKQRSPYHQFLDAIGVSHGCEALMYFEADEPTTAGDEWPGSYGYIKFHGSGCDHPPPEGVVDRDYQLADQFQRWCASQHLRVNRGYGPDVDEAERHAPTNPDRRFFLSREATDALRSIRERLGLTVDDLNCA